MKVLVSMLFAVGSLVAPMALPTLAVASTDVALACPADAPEGWKRPGGYCEQRNSLDTIGTEKGNGVSCMGQASVEPLRLGVKLRVAYIIYDPCCLNVSVTPGMRGWVPDAMMRRTDAPDVAINVCNLN